MVGAPEISGDCQIHLEEGGDEDDLYGRLVPKLGKGDGLDCAHQGMRRFLELDRF